ncbi:MAG: Arc family DNA-binding protein [Gordonibacter sp.]|nr:Arc family DNA-binding protein [Gordonibacter sp.]
MPALQVRDFPEEIYEQLRLCAERNHRSIAQQTIVAVEEMLQGENSARGEKQSFLQDRRSHYVDYDTEAARIARREQRKALFAEIHVLPKFEVPDDFPDASELVRQGHEERDRSIMTVIVPHLDAGTARRGREA